MTVSDPVRIVDVEGNIVGSSPDNPLYVSGGSGGSWFSDATAANQQAQISLADAANDLLAAIQVALGTINLDQNSATDVLNIILSELSAKADLTDTQPVSVAALPLPAGAATDAKLDDIITELGNVLSRLTQLTDPDDTQPVSFASLPLPAGAATETTLQATLDALADILTRLNALTDPTDTQPISATDLPLPTGAATLSAQTLGNDFLESMAVALGTASPDTAIDLLEAILAALPGIGGGGGYASETTALAILDALGSPSPDNIIELLTTLAGGSGGFALEDTAQDILARLLNLTDPSDTQPISAASLPLPAGASTAANQTVISGRIGEAQETPTEFTVLARLKTIAESLADVASETSTAAILAALGDIFTRLQLMTDPADTQPISAASLPLPTGAATASNQTSIITRLGEVQDTPTAFTVLDRLKTIAAGVDALLTELEGKADLSETQPVSLAALPPDAATETAQGLILSRLNALTDPADTQPVSLASIPLPTGAATSANQTDLISRVGEVTANPTANTVLDRLKGLGTTLAALLTELQAKADLTETQPVSLATIPLATDAATETTLAAALTRLNELTDPTATQPVSAASLPLPAGASTAAHQTTLLDRVGEVQASPTTNTVLDRLKVIADRLQSLIDDGIEISTIPLPADASTETTLLAILTALAGIQTRLDEITDPTDTQPVSVAALPLPAGGSTAANQSTLIEQIGEVQANPTANTVLDRLKVIAGLLTDTATETTAAAILAGLGDVLTRLNELTDPSTPQPVTAAALPLPTGAATETTLADANAKLPSLVSGRIPVDGSGVTQPVSITPTLQLFSNSGTGAISHTLTASQISEVKQLTLHLNAAPTTSEDFTISLRYNGLTNSLYETVIFRLDLSIGGLTDLIWQPDQPLTLRANDSLRLEWPNSDGRQWGQVTMMGVL